MQPKPSSPPTLTAPAQLAHVQLAAVKAEAERKALVAAAARSVATAAQQAQREGRLFSPQDIAAIKCVLRSVPLPAQHMPTHFLFYGHCSLLFAASHVH